MNGQLRVDKMRETYMKVLKTSDSKTMNSIPKSENRLLEMLIGKVFITGKNQDWDLNTSHCNVLEKPIAKANCSRKIEKILMKLQFTAIF
jgi:DNA-binding transcriptional regulator YbjK